MFMWKMEREKGQEKVLILIKYHSIPPFLKLGWVNRR
jgi:hypothetical protein